MSFTVSCRVNFYRIGNGEKGQFPETLPAHNRKALRVVRPDTERSYPLLSCNGRCPQCRLFRFTRSLVVILAYFFNDFCGN